MSKPQLYIFAISHYCEKARWALDYLGIEVEICHLAPGLHRRFAKNLSLRTSSLPILCVGSQVIQGSAAIIDWAEVNKANDLSLSSKQECNSSNAIEGRLDNVLGVHIRRYFYSEALVSYSHTVRHIFTRHLTGFTKIFITVVWPLIRKRMIQGMDLGSEQQNESREILEKELDWLDDLLADGREFLNGESFSREDITAASLLGPLVQPPKQITTLKLSPIVSADCERWKDRKCFDWVSNIYKGYR